MTDPVKPVSRKTAPQPQQIAPQEKKTVKIGNVEFRKDQIEANKTKTYMQNGKKMNTVFVKPGVQIDFPDQTNPQKHPSVESRGLRQEWYNYDSSWIDVTDLDNATITGAKNRSDYITLKGLSNNNKIIVDQDESWYINGDMKKDRVQLESSTSGNTVEMDEKDDLQIWYNQPEVQMNGQIVQSQHGRVNVHGKGTSEQELQLQQSLTEGQYEQHKFTQKIEEQKQK
ncbi:hypothetical protein J6P92_06970 [bacterium]|nr:hypothetical protein [bacterium]